MKLKERKKEIIIITIILIIQTIVFIIAGKNKSYLHMDESYSLGLASFDKIDIQENQDFYNTWHNNKYYEDYLTVNEDEKNNFVQIYENQKNDVHPPLYYAILRIAMGFHIDSYSKWTGIIVNIIIYAFTTIFMYLIVNKLLENKNKYKEKSAIIALVSSITLASITSVIYIRMYALATLNIVITTYLHIKLLEKREKNNILLITIGISALVGSLTHYYYLFYLVMLFIMLCIKYIKEKDFKGLSKYIITMITAGIASLIIFPYSIQHMFFGYRGQGTINNLINISKFIINIFQYIIVINVYNFNNILLFLIIGIILIIIYKKNKKKKIIEQKNKYIKYIELPTLFYFILVAISSPWIELRYIMPICGMIFIIVFYYIETILNNVVKEKILNIIMISIFLLMFIMPFLSNEIITLIVGKEFRNEKEYLYSSKAEIVEKLKSEIKIPIDIFSYFRDENTLLFVKDYKMEPEVLYSNKRNITKIIKEDLNVPTIYLLNSEKNRFLDDILLFASLNESYIAKDIECNENSIKKIMNEKNTSDGILIFINEGQENDKLINTIKASLNLNKVTYLKRLNSCDIYFIK